MRKVVRLYIKEIHSDQSDYGDQDSLILISMIIPSWQDPLAWESTRAQDLDDGRHQEPRQASAVTLVL
jgi:hypothetical protein